MADRYEDQYRRDRGYQRGDRGFMERAGDEVRSWFGDDEAERRRQMDDRDGGRFRDRDASGGYGSRSGWYDDRRYGQSGERGGSYGYGSGSGSYYGSSDRGQYGQSDRSYDYGSGSSSGRGFDDRSSGFGDRSSYAYGDRSQSYGDRSSGYGSSFGNQGYGNQGYGSQGYGSQGYGNSSYERPWSDRPYDRASGSESYRGGSDAAAAYGAGASWPERGERDRDRGTGWFAGRGPKGYQRSDERINEEVCDRLCDSGEIDATDVEVQVSQGQVTLTGRVADRNQKRRAEDLIEQISGVREVHNNLRVGTSETSATSRGDTTASTMGSSAASGTGSTAGSNAAAGTGNTGEQPGNVLGVTGGVDKTAAAGRR